jgi:predicted aldo/keto reductase-like oxidoreductase
MTISRRTFLGTTVAAATATDASPAQPIPARPLGSTGVKVSRLAYGCGTSWSQYGTFDEALATLSRAVDLGITYIDTAVSYGDGESEKIIGTLMPARRSQVFLATKIRERGYDEVMHVFEESLGRLQSDHVDLLHIHDLQGEDDLAAVEAVDGALRAVRKIRDEKMTRFIGITSHKDPLVLKTALERHDFDCVQMSLNPALKGEQGETSFESVALPVAVRKKMGVIAMKVFAQARYEFSAERLMRYALSLPVSTVSVGMPNRKDLEEDVRLAKAFEPMAQSEMNVLAAQLSAAHKADLEHFFRHHLDA